MVGSDAIAVDRGRFNESLEARVFGGRGVNALIERVHFLALGGLQFGERPVMLGDQAMPGMLVLGALRVQLALGRLDLPGQACVFGRRLRGLRAQFRERLLKRVDGRLTVGGEPLALALVLGNQTLESLLLGSRCLKAQLEGLEIPFRVAGGGGSCRMGRRERALQHRDVAAKLTLFLAQDQPALLELFFELGDARLSALAICRLRVEHLGEPRAFGLIIVGQHAKLQRFSADPFVLIADRLTHHRGALVVQPLRLRLLAEMEQQRLDTVRMVCERDSLNNHGASVLIADDEMTVEGRRAFGRASRDEFLPLRVAGREQAIGQAAVQDGSPLCSEEGERRLVAREQNAIETHPYQARWPPLEQPAQRRGVRRRTQLAGCSHLVKSAQLFIYVPGHVA